MTGEDRNKTKKVGKERILKLPKIEEGYEKKSSKLAHSRTRSS